MYQKLKKNPKKPTLTREKPTRKQLRKEKRQEKKFKRIEYHNKKKGHISAKEIELVAEEVAKKHEKVVKEKALTKSASGNKILSIEELHKKEKREQKKVEKSMSKQRKGQLLRENEKEDMVIKKLEKQLKLHKRKSKTIPKAFCDDGLDYLLEVCDPEYMKNAAMAEQDLNEGNDNFDEDFALMSGQKVKKNKSDDDEEDSDDFEDMLNEDDGTDVDDSDDDVGVASDEEETDADDNSDMESENIQAELSDSEQNESEAEFSDEEPKLVNKRKMPRENNDDAKKRKTSPQSEDGESENGDKKDDLWEDIYGRLRTKGGDVVNSNAGKYIPPAIRAKMEGQGTEDKKRKEKLDRLKKQLKGFLNRLAESNLHGISSQIEQLYMNNSRNDMNDTLTTLIVDSLIINVLSPERLLMEHILLVAILHANVGTEIGAHFMQTIIKKFDTLSNTAQPVEDKSLDNIVNILAQLYNFKVFDAKLLYEILQKLAASFDEKNIDCILHVLRSVGFGLRKDDPLALKNLILELQKQAASVSEGKVSNSRVKFLLDVLLAIKNNNVTKIPNYDTSYSEHLKKIMKGFVRKGNYVTTLNISLEDLLKADERGKWWVVGSAWTGTMDTTAATKTTSVKTSSDNFSQKLLDLAKKQRMNTDTRRDIFCIIMSAEDYMDAFEKLLKLGLKNQQEREIIHVILHCCLQEKNYNPYYAVLAQKFCEYDRKFQMTIKCSIWDKLKALNSHSGNQLANLAKLLTHLFIEKGLPISTLKIVEFSELDKITLRLMRQILLGILLYENLEAVQGVFEKVATSDKLKMFRESLRLFIHHFLLRNLKSDAIDGEKKQLLEERAKIIERILTMKENRLRL